MTCSVKVIVCDLLLHDAMMGQDADAVYVAIALKLSGAIFSVIAAQFS